MCGEGRVERKDIQKQRSSRADREDKQRWQFNKMPHREKQHIMQSKGDKNKNKTTGEKRG